MDQEIEKLNDEEENLQIEFSEQNLFAHQILFNPSLKFQEEIQITNLLTKVQALQPYIEKEKSESVEFTRNIEMMKEMIE